MSSPENSKIPKNGKLLIGVQQIMVFLQVSKPVFYKFIRLGMPAVVIDGRWYAYTDNIEEFLKALTRRTMKDISDDAE